MNDPSIPVAVVALAVITITVVVLLWYGLQRNRTQQKRRRQLQQNKETFRGGDALGVPHIKMGNFCVEDACLNGRDFANIVRLSSRFSERKSMVEKNFDAVDRRLDLLANNRDDAFSKLNDRFDDAAERRKTRFSDLDDQMADIDDMIELSNRQGRDVGALDGMTGARTSLVIAYAPRRLFGDYAGPQLRIRRSSDGTEADVFYDASGGVRLVKDQTGNTAKDLKAWTGGSTARVVRWFDQARRGDHDALESNASRAPYLSEDGLLFDDAHYMYIKNLNYRGKQHTDMSFAVWFKTAYRHSNKHDNWSFLDFDRSEHFNFYLAADSGRMAQGMEARKNSWADRALSSRVLNDGRWHHAVWTLDIKGGDQKLRMYVDGRLDSTHAVHGSFADGFGSGARRYGLIGRGSEANRENGRTNSVGYHGSMRDHTFFDAVLSPTQVKELYDNTKFTLAADTVRSMSGRVASGGLKFTWMESKALPRGQAGRIRSPGDFNRYFDFRSGAARLIKQGLWAHPIFMVEKGQHADSNPDRHLGRYPHTRDFGFFENDAIVGTHGPSGGWWEGYIRVDVSGEYTFAIDSDDAADFLIDGRLVCAYYGAHGVARDITRHTGKRTLVRGRPYRVQCRYTDHGGRHDGIALAWRTPGDDRPWRPVPATAFMVDMQDMTRGLTHAYLMLDTRRDMGNAGDFRYWFARATVLKKGLWQHKIHLQSSHKTPDAHIGQPLRARSLAWFDGVDPEAPEKRRKGSGNSFKGYLAVEKSGLYTFGLGSDDASDVLIDDRVVVAWYGGHGMVGDVARHTGSVQLMAGRFYRFECRVNDHGGEIDGIALAWKTPAHPSTWRAVPHDVFVPRD